MKCVLDLSPRCVIQIEPDVLRKDSVSLRCVVDLLRMCVVQTRSLGVLKIRIFGVRKISLFEIFVTLLRL